MADNSKKDKEERKRKLLERSRRNRAKADARQKIKDDANKAATEKAKSDEGFLEYAFRNPTRARFGIMGWPDAYLRYKRSQASKKKRKESKKND